MVYQSTSFGYQLRLESGEEIHSALTAFMKEVGIKGGSVIGIGAVASYSIGYYDLSKKEYHREDYDEAAELLSCVGNLSYSGETAVAHLHVVLSNQKMETRGGHLFEGVISATGEFSIIDSEIELKRIDKEKGFPFLDLPESLRI